MAIGNSVGDMATDISLAKIGFPQMGMTATVSGSVFNVMLGLGLSLMLQGIKGTISQPTPFVGSGVISSIVIMAGVGLISIMVSYMVIAHYTYTRTYAYIQILEYVILLIGLIMIQIF
jgi:Ca2+/Na+ antiporter